MLSKLSLVQCLNTYLKIITITIYIQYISIIPFPAQVSHPVSFFTLDLANIISICHQSHGIVVPSYSPATI